MTKYDYTTKYDYDFTIYFFVIYKDLHIISYLQYSNYCTTLALLFLNYIAPIDILTLFCMKICSSDFQYIDCLSLFRES